MINILYYSIALDNGGVEKLMYEWIRRITDENIHIDIVTEKILSQEIKNRFEIIGCKIFVVRYSKFPSTKKRQEIYQVIKEGHYQVVHAHIMATFHCDAIIAAKAAGVPVRIAHSHNIIGSAKVTTKLFHKFYRHVLLSTATDCFACSKMAGQSLFGRSHSFQLVHNGIDLQKFCYSKEQRKKIRDELHIPEGDILVGSVGRLSSQKNYSFLLNAFSKVCKEHDNFHLVLVGDGEERDKLENLVKSLSIEKNVIFYGTTQDVPGIMSAMDLFVLPSLYEGLVLVLVEAQAIGLPCLASSSIPNEVDITQTIDFMDLNKGYDAWGNKILELAEKRLWFDNSEKIRQSGYDIDTVSKQLKEYYQLSLIQTENNKFRT